MTYELFASVSAYYDAYEEARHSGESDYGVWWRDADGGTWRVTFVHDTGHVLAVSQGGVLSGAIQLGGYDLVFVSAGEADGPVVILGRLELATKPEADDATADRALDGWADVCGAQGSLEWAANCVRAASRVHP